MVNLKSYLAAVATAACLLLSLPALAEVFQGKVVGVTDGDTITVLHDGRSEKIRLASIDCPEKGQPYGQQAKRFTSELVFGKIIQVDASGKDRYGRTIAELRTGDGKVVNEELVKAGLAWWYRRYAPDDQRLAEMERQAREKRLGLWADPDPVAPWDFRKAQRAGAK